MALAPWRSQLARGRHAVRRRLVPRPRAYATDPPTTGDDAAPPPTPTPTPTPAVFSAPDPLQAAAAAAADGARPPPRWSQTPAGMKAPLQMDFARDPRNKIWIVNNNPARLEDMYVRLLGHGGGRMLPEELKWLAVTHKSFDQGRRGFNDRLALVGRLTLVMEATKFIVSRPPLKGARVRDDFGRAPFENKQLASVDNLGVEGPKDLVGKEKLYKLATDVGMLDVLRWKPRLPNHLEASGVEVVMSAAVMAIIGAINLQHGAAVASKTVKERVLARVSRD